MQDNLAAFLPQVDQIVIVDNGSENIDAIKECLGFFEKIYLICKVDNMGIATALNQIFDYAKVIGKEYVLTIDQDSVVYPDIIAEYRKYFGMENVVSFTSLREDRNFALSQTPKTDEQRIFEEIDQCITSGNLVKISAWECIGGFDERLFIDRVDYDFCYRLRRNGYKIILINKVEILHELGSAFTVRFDGRERIILNHSAFRKYYIFRNTVYLIRKYPESKKYFSY